MTWWNAVGCRCRMWRSASEPWPSFRSVSIRSPRPWYRHNGKLRGVPLFGSKHDIRNSPISADLLSLTSLESPSEFDAMLTTLVLSYPPCLTSLPSPCPATVPHIHDWRLRGSERHNCGIGKWSELGAEVALSQGHLLHSAETLSFGSSFRRIFTLPYAQKSAQWNSCHN